MAQGKAHLPSHPMPLVDDESNTEHKPITTIMSLYPDTSPTRKYNIPPAPTAPAFNCFPLTTVQQLSPPWEYNQVRVVMQDPDDVPFVFALAQDNGGMDVGIGIPESTMSISTKNRYATQVAITRQGKANSTIAVCRLQVLNPPMDVYTIVQGLPEGMIQAGNALVGRFMVQDAVVRTYVGSYAGQHKGISAGSWRNVSAPPSFDVLVARFRESVTGKYYYQEVQQVAERGAVMFQAKAYEQALASFQWASVVGFFTHSNAEQYPILKNLASGWEKYLLSKNDHNLEVPLYWAREAQKVQDTEVVQGQIARIMRLHVPKQ